MSVYLYSEIYLITKWKKKSINGGKGLHHCHVWLVGRNLIFCRCQLFLISFCEVISFSAEIAKTSPTFWKEERNKSTETWNVCQPRKVIRHNSQVTEENNSTGKMKYWINFTQENCAVESFPSLLSRGYKISFHHGN